MKPDFKVLESIVSRAHYLANQMIFQANDRDDKQKGDPKVGGHSAASASAIHLTAGLHLMVKSGFDHIANKPHASPADHAYNYLLGLLFHNDGSFLSTEESNQAMMGLRAFSQRGEPVFQSYHSAYDPDRHNFFPSGTVGIPPVQAGYLALAYRFAKEHGFKVPEAHFWAIIGDSEFREGSLFEAIPDFAERELGGLTWIVDYNRQSLDGHRITNPEIIGGNDHHRIEKTLLANGWDVIQLHHGSLRKKLFAMEGGPSFQKWIEKDCTDYEIQSLLLLKDGKEIKSYLSEKLSKDNKDNGLKQFLSTVKDKDLFLAMRDLGGHDLKEVCTALEKSKENSRKPCLIIAHTVKGWGLNMAAASGNHSALPSKEEMQRLQETQGIDDLFAGFTENSKEGQFLKQRKDQLYSEMTEQKNLKEMNSKKFLNDMSEFCNSDVSQSLNVNLKMASYPHTQWMLGQLTAKLTRIANTPAHKNVSEGQKVLSESERLWKSVAELLVSMAPDVGTSTNLNPAMDGKVFGAEVTEDIESAVQVKDKKQPDLIPSEEQSDRFIRFEIAEANTMSCVGSFGQLRNILGIPILPLMTVYDFFIKRALDQYFYNLYWQSSFILVGTPSGFTLAPEGAQHGWKSDIQIPNQITWEPYYCQELDWIFCDAVKRHITGDNEKRMGVLIRGVTRGADQKQMLKFLKQQSRYKVDPSIKICVSGMNVSGATDESTVESISENEIVEEWREQVLSGAYFLIDYKGYADYSPGDNVVHIFSMGSPTTEAIEASQKLLKEGIYANVIVVTSPDLLAGPLGHEDSYNYLKNELGISSKLYLNRNKSQEVFGNQQVQTFAGSRIPIVSVHDGEPGFLDNLGSIVGVRQETLAMRKHSRCGRPSDIYSYHGIDTNSIVSACKKVLTDTSLEDVQIQI